MTAPKRKRADKPASGSKSRRLAPKPAAAEAAKVEAPVTAPPVAGADGALDRINAANDKLVTDAVRLGIDLPPPPHRDPTYGVSPASVDLPPINPPDRDGDGKPGGGTSALAQRCAQVAYAACHEWGLLNPDYIADLTAPWPDLPGAARDYYAIRAAQIIDGSDGTSVFDGARWESSVRNGIFAAVVRVIAL